MIKKCFKFIIFSFIIFALFSCKKNVETKTEPNVKPDMNISNGEPNIDFTVMHNFVIDSISSQPTPFFYIVENKFDISGDNDKKNVVLTCTCLDGTTIEDLDLFLSMALNYVGINAAEQDFRFKAPTVNNDGSYNDFGTFFNLYSLEIHADTQKGETLRNDFVKAGNKIPVDPRYILE